MAHAIFFYVFSSIAIISAIMVTASKNTVHSVFFLILDFISISCLFIMLVAEFLQENFNNYEIIYPGLKSHKNHDIAKKQMNMFGGMLSIITDGNIENVREILNKFEVFTLAESLGGVESLVSHPATMTHASIPKEKREELGIKDGLIRLSIGLETIDDILSDLKAALS